MCKIALQQEGEGMEIKLKSRVKINGIETEIVSSEEAENSDQVVCVLESQEPEHFKADNIHTVCAGCGAPIVHRPHAPKRPPKVCMECAIIRMQCESSEKERGTV